MKVTVNLDGMPNFTLKVKVKAIIKDIEILTGKRTDTEFYVQITVKNIEVLALYDDNMHPIVAFHKNEKIFNAIRHKMAENKITKEIKVKMINIADKVYFEGNRIIAADNYVVMTGLLHTT